MFVGLSLAQDSNSSSRPSADDCSTAANYGRPLPSGCQQDDSGNSSSGTTGASRQQQELPQTQAPQLTGERPENTERQALNPINPSQLRIQELPPRPHTEFEQIVADTVGRALPLFGQSLFVQPPSTFAPTDRVQVPSDYVIGPDDQLQIRIWGQINADLRAAVDRSGQIYIPRVGQISVAGVHYGDLDQYLKREIMKFFRNFSLSVSIGKIRSIQIFVVGHAHYPGTYTISSLSTMFNAVFASGGPTPQGSLRDVQIQRDGKTIAHLDFYDLLVKGDKSRDVRLQSGDVLYYPPVGPLVAIGGSVNTPAIYEMKTGSTLAELVDVAGGLSTVADSSKVTVERIREHASRSVLEFPIDAESRALTLNDGDIVRVFSIVPRFDNAVTLRGNVVNPGRYPWKPGMRVRDLIPNAQALLTRTYWLGRAAMIDGRSTEYPIQVRRSVTAGDNRNRNYSRTQGNSKDFTLPAEDVDQLPANDQRPNDLQNNDRRMRDQQGSNSQSNDVQDGDLQYQYNDQPDNSRPDNYRQQSDRRNQQTSEQAGRRGGETLTRDLHRASPEINWNYAIVQRVDPLNLSTKLLSFNLGKAVLDDDAANNLELRPDDIVTIFSQTDISVPQSLRARYVKLEGEVVRAGVYKIEDGEPLRDVIKRAGGVTSEAYIYGTQLTRESAREDQQKSIDELARTVETEMRQAAIGAAARSTSEDAQALAAQQASQQSLIDQLHSVRATGRVVLTLSPNTKSIDDFPDISMEDNDRVFIPHLPSTVSVVGVVYNPGSFVFSPRRTAGEYLKMAGTGKRGADLHHAFLLHADGTVLPSTSVNGMFSGDRFAGLHLHPGDQLVVPNKIQSGAFVRGLRDWSQITSQMALTGAALAVIQ